MPLERVVSPRTNRKFVFGSSTEVKGLFVIDLECLALSQDIHVHKADTKAKFMHSSPVDPLSLILSSESRVLHVLCTKRLVFNLKRKEKKEVESCHV